VSAEEFAAHNNNNKNGTATGSGSGDTGSPAAAVDPAMPTPELFEE